MPLELPNPSEIINQANAEFWIEQKTKMQSRVEDEQLRDQAMAELENERLRGVPLKNQQTLEAALQGAANFKANVISGQASKAAKAQRSDRLQTLILKAVENDATITRHRLLQYLRRQADGDVIEYVDGVSIGFTDESGRPMSAKVSGLKDRLSRAKQKNSLALAG